ncbi:LamG-like jellyroll fold domain-containing protein [Bacteroides sp. f07]|uniref:LamG-like jellyroll fold domain-containing protein n=1 Tax=Bacteroides sp. f07 TaxID=3132704 RepID=UPI0036F31FC5
MKKYIYSSIALFLLGFMVQSCFQDMDHPGFDYPEELPEKPYNPMKLGLAFEDNLENNSIYNFGITAGGTPRFAEGINGKAYQGAADTYMVAETPEALKDSIENLGSFTVAFWMKSGAPITNGTGLFTISNTEADWGNLDIYLEWNYNGTEAKIKVRMNNVNSGTEEIRWLETLISDVLIDDWVHMAFKYDEKTSTLEIYRNAEKVVSQVYPNYGKLKFKNVGKMALGAFQFTTNPRLTDNTSNMDWARNYSGMFDQFHFYNKALKRSEIRNLYVTKD